MTSSIKCVVRFIGGRFTHLYLIMCNCISLSILCTLYCRSSISGCKSSRTTENVKKSHGDGLTMMVHFTPFNLNWSMNFLLNNNVKIERASHNEIASSDASEPDPTTSGSTCQSGPCYLSIPLQMDTRSKMKEKEEKKSRVAKTKETVSKHKEACTSSGLLYTEPSTI